MSGKDAIWVRPRQQCTSRLGFLSTVEKHLISLSIRQFVKSNGWDSWLLVTLTGSTTVAPRFRPGLKPGWASSEAVGKVWQDRSFFWILVELMKVLKIVWNWRLKCFSGFVFRLCSYTFSPVQLSYKKSLGPSPRIQKRLWKVGQFSQELQSVLQLSGKVLKVTESHWKSRRCWKILKGVWRIITWK